MASLRRRGFTLGMVLALGALLLDSPLVSAQDAQPGQEDQQRQQNQERRGRGEGRARGGGERGPGPNWGPRTNRGPGSDRGPEGNRGAGRDRGPGGGRGPNGDRGPGGGLGRVFDSIRGLPPGPITAEMREQFYNRVSEGHFRRLTDIYTLNEDQKAQVKQQLKDITQKQREYTDPIMKEVEPLMRERFSLDSQRRAGQAIDESRFQQVTDRLRQMRDQSPLMNFDNVANEVEKTLPADQVAQGQQRRAESRAREDARREEWRQRREEMRAQREAQRQQEQQGQTEQPAQQQVQPEQNAGVDQGQAEGGQSPPDGQRRGRGPRGDRQQRFQRAVAEQQVAQDQQATQDGQDQPFEGRGRGRDARPAGDPWDEYVAAFIRRYHLDESQQSSARSLLRTYKNERQQYRDARRTDYAAAEALENDTKRRDEMERLNKGIDRLFDALKEKLERIPTDDQLTKYGSRRRSSSERENATSRPAADSPRLPAADSQPAAAPPTAQPAAASQPG